MMQVIKSSEDRFVWNLTCSNTIKESDLESTCTPKHHVRTLAPGRGEEPQTTAAEAVGVKTEKGKGKKKKNRWLDGDQARSGHVTGAACHGTSCSRSLSVAAVGVTTRAVCVNFEAPAEQIGQSARIIRRKTLLISRRLPRPHSHTLSLFLSSLRAGCSSKLCRGRAEDLENMSS